MGTEFVIGELAKRTGYSPAMIRYFEKTGTITPSTRNSAGYRLFGASQVRELRFVRKMQNLGLHAKHIKTLREITMSDLPDSAKKARIQKVFEEHARHVDGKIAHFMRLKTQLDDAAADFVDSVLGSHSLISVEEDVD